MAPIGQREALPVPAPPIGWRDLAGSAVGVWGLGVEGTATLRRLEALGLDPVLVDDRPEAAEAVGRPVHATAKGGLEALARCEVVVKAPGISRYRSDVAQLASAGVLVAGGLGLWLFDVDRDRVVVVTGTKGKSTTAVVAGHLAAGLGRRSLVAGNFGRPPWDPDTGGGYDLFVVETSSFQCTDLPVAPPVVAVTSLAPDHLDWHGGVDAYYRDKLAVCTLPGARLTVADGTSGELRARRDRLGPEVRWVVPGDPHLDGTWVDHLGLFGEHNRRNALVARATLLVLGVSAAADVNAVARAASGFGGLESRLRPIGTVAGVEFVDDSLSTNVLPTLAALDAFEGRRLALLVGGHDRGIDYRPLADALVARAAPTLVVTLPTSGARVHAALDEASGAQPAERRPEVVDAADLGVATAAAFDWARPGGMVLLSPAAPSFGQFRDYRHRGAAFAEAMRACARSTGSAEGGSPASGPPSGHGRPRP